MLMTILGWVAGLPLGQITSALKDAYSDKLRAETDTNKIAADERIEALRAQQAVLVAEAGSRVNAVVRAVLTFPVAAFMIKVIFIDKVLGLGVTDDLSPNLWTYVWIVVGFYFVHSMVTERRS